jgi:flagellar hook-length control protein FliK
MTAPSAPTSPASAPTASPPPGSAAPPGAPPGGPLFQSALEDSARTALAEGHQQSPRGGRRSATADAQTAAQTAAGLAPAGAPPAQAATALGATGGPPAKPLASSAPAASDAPAASATTGAPATKDSAGEAPGTPGVQAGASPKAALPAGGAPPVEDSPALPGSAEPSSTGATAGAVAGASATSATQDAAQLSQAGPRLGASPTSTPVPTANSAPVAQSANPTAAPHSAAPSPQNPLPDALRAAAAHDGRDLTTEKAAAQSAPAVSLPPSASGAATHATPGGGPNSFAPSGLAAGPQPAAPAGVAVSLTALDGAEGSPAPTGAGASTAGYGVDLQHAIEAVHATIELATRQGVTQARIALQPEELGEIRIHLTQSASGLVARVTADSPAAAQALTEGRAELRSSLSALGLTTLHLDTGAFQSGAEGRGHASQQSAGFAPARRTSDSGDDADLSDLSDPSPDTTSPPPRARGALVDVLA